MNRLIRNAAGMIETGQLDVTVKVTPKSESELRNAEKIEGFKRKQTQSPSVETKSGCRRQSDYWIFQPDLSGVDYH